MQFGRLKKGKGRDEFKEKVLKTSSIVKPEENDEEEEEDDDDGDLSKYQLDSDEDEVHVEYMTLNKCTMDFQNAEVYTICTLVNVFNRRWHAVNFRCLLCDSEHLLPSYN